MPNYRVTWKEGTIEYSVVIHIKSRLKAINAFHRIKEAKELLQTSTGYKGSFPVDSIIRIDEVGKE
ncbi:MAG: hypothetical protein JRN11_06495 [Nitrososphaerota archaeon]|nr:hypothetical protein [Nitrososphaerota archaeon]MDG7026379.1 hypothetical protein [Nitrososphaerota archaeon]